MGIIQIVLDDTSGTYQATSGTTTGGGLTPAEALRALAEVLDGQKAKAEIVAQAATDAALQTAILSA